MRFRHNRERRLIGNGALRRLEPETEGLGAGERERERTADRIGGDRHSGLHEIDVRCVQTVGSRESERKRAGRYCGGQKIEGDSDTPGTRKIDHR
jgi:hypothetical protein